MSDYRRLSWNKIETINGLSDIAGFGLERIKFLFPVLEFHGKWDSLTSDAYDPQYRDVKAGSYYGTFLYACKDVSESYVTTNERIALADNLSSVVNDLFDYLEESNVRVLFVRLPQALGNEKSFARLNTVCDMIQERGFDFVDMQDDAQKCGLDYAGDFYNMKHANIHGSNKFTHYLGSYLKERYGFTDKRGQEGYEDWVAADERYTNFVRTALFDFELDHSPIDPALSKVSPRVTLHSDRTASLVWSPVSGADSLYVYRRRSSPARRVTSSCRRT